MLAKSMRTSALVLSIILIIALSVQKLDIPSILYGLLVMVVTGRIAGTESYITFEAVLGGFLFFGWLALAYRFGWKAITMIGHDLKPDLARKKKIEEIAL